MMKYTVITYETKKFMRRSMLQKSHILDQNQIKVPQIHSFIRNTKAEFLIFIATNKEYTIILILKMNQEKSKKLARKLFEGQASNWSKENVVDPKVLQQKNTFQALKDSIQSKQRQRLKNKYQLAIKNKESDLEDIVKKCNNLQITVKKEKAVSEAIRGEKQQLAAIVDKISCQISEKQSLLKDAQQTTAKFQQENIALIKQEKEASKKLWDAQVQLQKLQRQYSITSKKDRQTLNDQIEKLKAKLRIKQKQQQKIQGLFKQKAVQYEEIIRSKQEEIAFLQAEYAKLKLENQQISEQLWETQRKDKVFFQEFENEIQQLTFRIKEAQKEKQARQVQLQAGINKFKGQLGLQSLKDEFLEQLQEFSSQLKNKKQEEQQISRIQQLQLQLQKSRTLSKEYKGKLDILEEELLFFKREMAKNNEFQSAFKSHLTSLSENFQSKQSQKEEIQNRSLMGRTMDYKIVEHGKTHSLRDQQSCSVQLREKSKEWTNSAFHTLAKHKQQVVVAQENKKKSANDFLKQQLQSKKKSLIYMMYKRKEEEECNKRQIKKAPTPIQTLQKRRSNSLGALVSAKCKSQLL